MLSVEMALSVSSAYHSLREDTMRSGKVRIGIAAAVVAVMLPVLTSARQEVVHAVVPLKHVPATRVQRLLTDGLVRGTRQKPEPLRIDGMDYMATDTVRAAVLAVGTEKAIGELRKIVALLDVPIPVLTVDMRILRSVRQADGSLKTEVLATPTVKTLNGEEASVSIGDDARQITAAVDPRMNGDHSVTVTAELRANRSEFAGVYHRITRRLKQNQADVMIWLPDVVIGDGAKPGLIGITRALPNEQPGYFLEVTLREEPSAR